MIQSSPSAERVRYSEQQPNTNYNVTITVMNDTVESVIDETRETSGNSGCGGFVARTSNLHPIE